MKSSMVLILWGFVAAGTCWEFPGHPGTDCVETLEIMLKDPERQWMLPTCKDDRTFEPMQCHSVSVTDGCMCVAPDGSPLTLPGFGLNVITCDCFMETYDIYLHGSEDIPKCASDGTYEPLQCSKATGLCRCVDKRGKTLSEPSAETKAC